MYIYQWWFFSQIISLMNVKLWKQTGTLHATQVKRTSIKRLVLLLTLIQPQTASRLSAFIYERYCMEVEHREYKLDPMMVLHTAH